jgi:hypothetical protein
MLAALALLGACGGAPAQSLGDDAAAKAKLVAALVRFVQWPTGTFDSDASALRLCVYSGSAAVERAFAAHQGSAVGARTLRVVLDPPAADKGCHAVYLDASAGLGLPDWRRRHAGEAAFTIGTSDGFASDGGMVEIVQVDSDLRFDFNLQALHDAGLGVHPGVLKLARRVKP